MKATAKNPYDITPPDLPDVPSPHFFGLQVSPGPGPGSRQGLTRMQDDGNNDEQEIAKTTPQIEISELVKLFSKSEKQVFV